MKIDIPQMIALLKQGEATLPDPRNARSETERATVWTLRHEHAMVISNLMNLPSDLERAHTRLDDVEARRQETVERQTEIEAEIAAFTDWRLAGDARACDAEHERQRQVGKRLERLRAGTLVKGSGGGTYEPIDYLDRRIRELTERRDGTQSKLDSYVAQAEALLAAVVPK